MLFDPLKRGELSTLLGRTAVLPGEGQQGQPLSCSPASKLDRGIHVLILIPTLNVGGAEMDLVRVVPRIDRARFRVTVCTFLERGELSEVMQSYGIEVIGPFSPLYYFRLRLRRMVQQLLAFLRSPLKAAPSAWRQHIRRIAKSIWMPLARKLTAFADLPTFVVVHEMGMVSLENLLFHTAARDQYFLAGALFAAPGDRLPRGNRADRPAHRAVRSGI